MCEQQQKSAADGVADPPCPEMLASGYLGYECFQNYTAPEVFVQGLAGSVSREDIEAIIRSQKIMLQRFEKTNAMLTNCNALSAQRLQNTTVDFKRHVQMLTDMKKDLSQVFERIRKLKSKLAGQYPKQFSDAANRAALPEEEEVTSQPAAAVAGAGAGAVRRRQRPVRPPPAATQLKRHSYHASVSAAAAAGAGGSADRPRQESEPPPHSSSDSDDDGASVSSTNS